MRVDRTEKIISSLLQDARYKTQDSRLGTHNSKLKTEDWIPWFPVIDYDLCKNCKQCFNFCLFGVYELTEQGKVQVKNPANCKTNCPACARMCPNSAIMFPKYTDSPINGDAVDEKALEAEKTKINLKEFMDGNVYDAIRRHSEKGRRFSKNREQHYE
jgi:NAD-dependent dihydropyrimidine dehydrogenase PreA subunit